jgi:hypothetical protein
VIFIEKVEEVLEGADGYKVIPKYVVEFAG